MWKSRTFAEKGERKGLTCWATPPPPNMPRRRKNATQRNMRENNWLESSPEYFLLAHTYALISADFCFLPKNIHGFLLPFILGENVYLFACREGRREFAFGVGLLRQLSGREKKRIVDEETRRGVAQLALFPHIFSEFRSKFETFPFPSCHVTLCYCRH